MLGEPLHSPYDWNFRLFGFEVRVTWLFWLLAAGIGYDWAVNYDRYFGSEDSPSPGRAALLAIWVAAVLLSILIHELGHAFVMRYYRIDSYIVLYHFGGLAIPSAQKRYDGAREPMHGYAPGSQLLISLAGPAAQLLLAVVVAAIACSLGYTFPFSGMIEQLLPEDTLQLYRPERVTTASLIDFLIYPSVYWALFNLLPVLPLDGGRILQHTLSIYFRRDGFYEATVVSVVTAFLVAFWGFQTQQTILALMFILFGINNFQNMRGGLNRF